MNSIVDDRSAAGGTPAVVGGTISSEPAWWLLGIGLAGSAVFLVMPSASSANDVYQAAGLLVIAGGWAAVLARRGAMRGVGLLLAGATAWLLGDSLWWILDLTGHPVGYPSFVDAVYFAGYPLLVGGLVVVWRRLLASVLGGLLDGAALAAAGGLLLWVVVVDPSGGVHEPALLSITSVAYPALDLFVLIGLGLLALTPALRRGWALPALIAGILASFASDVFYAYGSMRGTYVDATWRDTGWLLFYVLWAFALAHPSVRDLAAGREHRLPTHPTRIAFLALGCLTAPIAMFVAIRRDTFEPGVFTVAMSVILVLVFWRTAVILADHRRAEADADEGREFYRALVENGPDLVMLMDLDGGLLFASPSFEPILGYAPTEVVGRSMLSLTDPEDLPIAHAALAAAGAGDTIPPFTIRARDVHGSAVWLEVTATLITARGGPAILSQARDVTKPRLAERSLAETSRTLETLVAASPTAVVALDLEGCVTLWSPGAAQLFGWTAEETLGRRSPLRTADDFDRAFFERYFEHGPVVEEGARPRKDGTRVDVSLSSIPLHDTNGAVRGVIGVFLDISERKLLEERLRQAQRLESVGQLAGGVAHDFNNLLTAIRGYANLALGHAGDDQELRAHHDEIARAGESATELTRKLLAFSRRQTLQLTTFDLNRTVAESTGLLSRVLGEHVRIDTSFLRGACVVRADPGQIEQVLMNLAVNGRDAMADGGTLTIETDRVELADAEANALEIEPGAHVVLRVSDTGAGMDAETAAHAFDPFFTTKPVGQGTGLGLATVYGIVRQSGGAITIDSTPGRGTRVEVFLQEDRSGTVAGVPAERREAPRGRERILLVEDEEAVRRLTTRLLEAQGYEVVEAAGPGRALELAADTAIDLLATDITMPEMDGTELAARLRDRRPDLPVLFLSGYPRGASLNGALSAARTSFLQKPYDLKDLALAVRATLDDRGGGG